MNPQMLAWSALAGSTVLLAAATAARLSPATLAASDRTEYFRRWSILHGGYRIDGSWLASAWLGLVYRLARPLAIAGVSPTVLTFWGLLFSGAVPVVASSEGRWPLLCVVLVLVAGVLDNLDGAVAVLTGRTTRFGYVLDSAVDRLSDSACLLAFMAAGASGELCAAAIGLSVLQEYVRARAGSAGMSEIGVVTVWERPTRLILVGGVLLACGLLPDAAPGLAGGGACGAIALGVIGLAQLAGAVRTAFRD